MCGWPEQIQVASRKCSPAVAASQSWRGGLATRVDRREVGRARRRTLSSQTAQHSGFTSSEFRIVFGCLVAANPRFRSLTLRTLVGRMTKSLCGLHLPKRTNDLVIRRCPRDGFIPSVADIEQLGVLSRSIQSVPSRVELAHAVSVRATLVDRLVRKRWTVVRWRRKRAAGAVGNDARTLRTN